MSILLVDPPPEPGVSVVERLVAQGDQVRVICAAADADRWRRLGAHVATGDAGDIDLLAAAGTGARTLVVLRSDRVAPAVAAARICGADRIVALVEDASSEMSDDIDHVVLIRHKRRLRRAGHVSDERLAAAVDAADDLAGNPRLILDLDEADAWGRLGLD